MNILETIIAKKKIEVAQRKSVVEARTLESLSFFKKENLSFSEFLSKNDKTGIIAEFKRKSPSKGIINNTARVEEVVSNYVKFGASAVSVLTDEIFFGGSLSDLSKAALCGVPVLRKDFMIDEYQIVEAKAYGADVILLIAACLTNKEVKKLSTFAKSLGIGVLLEIHNEAELNHICDEVDVVGINNRDLKTFEVDLKHSVELGKKISPDKIKISESGIDETKAIHFLKENGFNGFLIGEKFMKEKEPGKAFMRFAEELKK